MKPNFALSLSFEGLRLMHRATSGWHLVGQVALDDPHLTDALTRLRTMADTLEPDGIATKILIPNDQIKYLALDTTRTAQTEVEAALDGATPYAVPDLAYDFTKGGGRTYVAAVAKETLLEAEQFATEYGFNPISFAAVPEPFTFVGEVFFGATEGNSAEREAQPVVVTGTVQIDGLNATPDVAPAVPPTTAESSETKEIPSDAKPSLAKETVKTKPIDADTASAPVVTVADTPIPESQDGDAGAVSALEAGHDATDSPTADDGPDAPPDAKVDAKVDEAPVFTSSLRADRSAGRPTPTLKPAPTKDAKPDAASARRAEPTFGRAPSSPPLAVPTGKGTDPMPPVNTPARDAAAVAPPTPPSSFTAHAPTAETAPAITGEAPTALPDAAIAAASLTAEPNVRTPDTRPAKAPPSAPGAVKSAVGGIFASRRSSGTDAKTDPVLTKSDGGTTTAFPDETKDTTVFGARKQPKSGHVVGGKPRFLGLILTAILLLFLLAFAAFAAMSDLGIAAWFGFGSQDTQVATQQDTQQDQDAASRAVPEVAAVLPSEDDESVIAPDALAVPADSAILATNAEVLSPEEASRIYAATGVWQRAPRIPLTPRTTSIDDMQVGEASQPVPRVPPSPLASASSVAGDALIATPIDPPAPDTTFNFGEDGFVVATEQGALTPDGILVLLGSPPLNPPTRPGTVAPVITPQDLIADVIPENAEPLTDAPEGVIVISGRPSIEPPVRTGTVPPSPDPQEELIAAGTEPLVANEGLLVLAGSPPVSPPVRPGTTAGAQSSDTPVVPEIVDETPDTRIGEPAEGLNVIEGEPPPVLPPSRPGTDSPQEDAAAETLSSDVAEALTTGTAKPPNSNTRRPRDRPTEVILAAVKAAEETSNAPVVEDLTPQQAPGFRPRNRPADLAPATTTASTTPEPDPQTEPEIEVAAAQPPAAAPTGLQLSPEIAAAVAAAANRPNPIVNPTAQAVSFSRTPDTRPRNMDRIVARASQTQQRVATQVAAVVPQTAAVAPSGPTAGSVAQTATVGRAINLRDVNLIGIFGSDSDRRALVRLSNGRYERVTVGDNLDGGRVTAISAGALSYTKRGRAITLQVAG